MIIGKTNMGNSHLLDCMAERVLLFDGAMGTGIHARQLPLNDFNGLENCSEILNITRPDVIADIHRTFLDVGSDAILTNTLGGSRLGRHLGRLLSLFFLFATSSKT